MPLAKPLNIKITSMYYTIDCGLAANSGHECDVWITVFWPAHDRSWPTQRALGIPQGSGTAYNSRSLSTPVCITGMPNDHYLWQAPMHAGIFCLVLHLCTESATKELHQQLVWQVRLKTAVGRGSERLTKNLNVYIFSPQLNKDSPHVADKCMCVRLAAVSLQDMFTNTDMLLSNIKEIPAQEKLKKKKKTPTCCNVFWSMVRP